MTTNTLKKVQAIIDKRKATAVSKAQRVLDTLRTHAEWRDCESDLHRAIVNHALCSDSEKASAKQQVDEATAKLNELAKFYNVTESDLAPHYTCSKCKDTGRIGDKRCSCFNDVLRSILFKESNICDSSCTFSASKEIDKHNCLVYKEAEKCCGKDSNKNIMLFGKTGTGKTYLLLACANKCIENCKSVLFATAYNLNQHFLEIHCSPLEAKNQAMQQLTDVDVLVIDDLGTENIYKNVSSEYLFAVINERALSNKQTFISTNLTLEQFRERYDERIFSRMANKEKTFIAQLLGDDKRVL